MNEQHVAYLRRGVRFWNAWRANNIHTNPDLSGANLSRLDLTGCNLGLANLAGADLSESILLKANLFLADLSGATCYDTNFSNAFMSGTNLSGTDLRKAHMYGAQMVLDEAKMVGTQITEEQLSVMDLKRKSTIAKNE